MTHRPRLDLLNLSSFLNTVLFNQQAHLDVSKLLDIKPQLNTEFLRIAVNLLQSQCHNQNLFKQNQVQDSQSISHQTTSQQLPASLLYNPAQFIQPSQWQNNEPSSSNLSESFVTSNNNLHYENNEQPISSLLYEISNGEVASDPYLYSNLDSVLSTPVSTVALNNSCTIINNSTEEEEKDTYCSNLYDFQIPDLLDMSEFA